MNISFNARQYPRLPKPSRPATRPISFVVVRFSNEFEFNFKRSPDVHNPLNQVVVVDNTANLYFNSLVGAIGDGLRRARHDLIAVIHEDVLLPEYWQPHFEGSLSRLEAHDPDWGMVGSVGWDASNNLVGHWSDPHGYGERLPDVHGFGEVFRLDEQLLVFHRARLPELDADIPGIHHLGHHLAMQLRVRELKTYAIDAPTIHKYADGSGRLIKTIADSGKIMDRRSLTYLADRACCNEYMKHLWPNATIEDYREPILKWPVTQDKERQLEEPIVLVSRGGSGSRLLSAMVLDAGIHLVGTLNVSGDTMDMVLPVYQGLVEKYQCKAEWQKAQTVPRIRAAAARVIAELPPHQPWGFKLPETLLLLPEIISAFPRARFVHLLRDPIATCLRRTHQSARLDNHIGRIALPLAYDAMGIERKTILTHSPAHHMAYTTIHQLGNVYTFRERLDTRSFFECRFEDLLVQPEGETERLCQWLGTAPTGSRLPALLDSDRAKNPKVQYPDETVREIEEILRPLRTLLGYAKT